MAGAHRPVAAVLSRRRLLVGLLAGPPTLAACSLGGSAERALPDPLIALAGAARADAALALAALVADPGLADRVEPLRVARSEHAAALDAEVARLDPGRTPAPTTSPAAPTPEGTLARIVESVQASAAAAAAAALELPAERVGLVASVAACCATYVAVLG